MAMEIRRMPPRRQMLLEDVMKKKDSHIWCENCGIVPLIKGYMKADERNDHPSTDLICVNCRLVIATIHHLEKK